MNIDPIEGLLFAEHAIKYVIEQGARFLYNQYLVNKIPFYTSEDIIYWNDGILQQQYISIDRGESKYQMLNKWNEEDEPKSCVLDNIATLSVKIDRVKMTSFASGTEDQDDTKSMRSMSSRVSFASKFQRATKKITQSKLIPKNNGLISEPIEDDSYVYELVEMPDDRPVPEPDPIAERMRDEREIKNKDRYREQERMKKVREDQAVYEEKKKEQQKQLKHKLYTWDFDGEIILLKQGKGSETTLQVNEILQIDGRSREPGVIVKENNTVPEVKPVKEGLGRGDDEHHKYEKAIATEYTKQPPLLEIIQPRVGVNVIFDNGYVKEGGEFKREKDKISKEEYNQIIENQPRIKPTYGQHEDQIVQGDSLQRKLNNNVQEQEEGLPNNINKKINIDNIEQYMQMMAHETLRKSSNDTNKYASQRQSNLFQSKVKLAKLKVPHKQQNLERITAYKKGPLMQLDSPRGLTLEKDTKLHRAVEKFDQNLIDNPNWGMIGALKDSKLTATSYKKKNLSSIKSSPHLKNNKTQVDFFPPILQKPNEESKNQQRALKAN